MLRVGQVVLAAAALMCAVTTASAQSTASMSETKSFEVIAVDGNQLVVRLPEGTREIAVPAGFMFTVDGKQMSVGELKPGMKGTATITTKTTVTPVTVTQVKNGQVMQTTGSSIIVRTEEGVKMFTQSDVDKRGVKIVKDGQVATIASLRQGDQLTAVIVTSMPPRVVTEKEVQATLAANKAGGGTAAAPRPAAQAASQSASAGPAGGQSAAAGAPATAGTGGAGQRELPATGSPLPLVGLAGFMALLTGGALTIRRKRLSR